MQESLTLETVTQNFEHWRTHRKSRKESTPMYLQEQAVALLENYPATEIAKALRISGANFKRWRSPLSATPAKKNNTFVELPGLQAHGSQSGLQSEHLKINLRNHDGIEVTLQGSLSPELLTALLKSIGFNSGVVA